MNRILALAAIAALLVLGGLWLARSRERSAPVGSDTTPQPVSEAPVPPGFEPLPYLSETQVQTFEQADWVLADGLDYQLLLETSRGTLRIDLFEDRTPRTVNNVVFLALHRFYDGVVFHRVLDEFMAQTGDPTGSGRGGPGYRFDDEIADGLAHDAKGVVSMANAGPDTNGSQFFITFTATPWLDGRHAVFGRVIDGLDVLDALTRVNPEVPLAALPLKATLAELAAAGVALNGPEDRTLSDHIETVLGAVPVAGQAFPLEGYRAVMGSLAGEPAVGFFAEPDRIERAVVLAGPTGP